MTNVEPEEALAIQAIAAEGETGGPTHVEPRNFGVPHLVSEKRLRTLRRQVSSLLPTISDNIAVPLRAPYKLSIGSLAEMSAAALLDELEAPFVVLCFECSGTPCWVIWNVEAAVAAADAVLSGSVPENPEARKLSPAECRVVESLLGRVVGPLAEHLGLTRTDGFIAQEPDALTSPDDAGPSADPRRLSIHLTFDGPGMSSDLMIYLPGLAPEGAGVGDDAAAALPAHLAGVPMRLSTYLGTVDVPLTDLLKLEVGDVIPLGVRAGSPLVLFVEERPCAKVRFGMSNGALAVRIEELDRSAETIDSPG